MIRSASVGIAVVVGGASIIHFWKKDEAGSLSSEEHTAKEEEKKTSSNSSGTTTNQNELDSGYWLQSDRDYRIMPTERTCFYCCKDGKVHLLEHFTCYPCCGHYICLACMGKNSTSCGECITLIPYGAHALLWVQKRLQGTGMCNDRDKQLHLSGRICITGCHTYLDELIRLPVYQRLPLPTQMLAVMNPPNVALGVKYLTAAAENGVIAAMLDLGDTYSTTFYNDSFEKDDEKAEYWFRRALGQGNQVFPLAFTRYGLFMISKGRKSDARNLFEVAATYGHARGQYELACILLDENTKEPGGGRNDTTVAQNDAVQKALKWLCKASEKGFYVPSYIQLASVLINTAETVYGSLKVVGKSPLPRVLQILSLVKYEVYGSSAEVQDQADELLERYKSNTECYNCGVAGSENNPLMTCAGCGVISFCSKVCQRRCFRDGHRFDCCSREQLFDFHLVKLSLPWVRDTELKGRGSLPHLISSKRRTLMEMVEDDTDEIYGEDDLEYDEHIIVQLMLRMRNNLETFLGRILEGTKNIEGVAPTKGRSGTDAGDLRNINLSKRINMFGKQDVSASEEFVCSMHKIRELGNYGNAQITK